MFRHEYQSRKATPAHLSFLTIYNTSIGTERESLAGQIVFWYSPNDKKHVRDKSSGSLEEEHPNGEEEGENEKLRQIGLAQGMVNFAKNFSNGKHVNSIETEKHRIILSELEPDWWILSSIELTQLPASPNTSADNHGVGLHNEYSSRDVSPSSLLLQQLRRANSIFLMHNAPSLKDLWTRCTRDKFCEIVELFWKNYAENWDICLHGNPANDIFNGTKLAISGELGIGVGEEEWGSSEREVLEGLVLNTEGLEDMVLSRFGDPSSHEDDVALPAELLEANDTDNQCRSWIGRGHGPNSVDGVVFSGVGRISRQSVRDLSGWVEWIYTFGEDAYGLKQNVRSAHDSREQESLVDNRLQSADLQSVEPISEAELDAKSHSYEDTDTAKETELGLIQPIQPIPPPTPRTIHEIRSETGTSKQDPAKYRVIISEASKYRLADSLPKPEQMMKYLTLGYGTTWTGFGKVVNNANSGPHSSHDKQNKQPVGQSPNIKRENPSVTTPTDRAHSMSETKSAQILSSTGQFLIGVTCDTHSRSDELKTVSSRDENAPGDLVEDQRFNLPTIHVQLSSEAIREDSSNRESKLPKSPSISSSISGTAHQSTACERFKVIVYVHRPFIFTLLFDENTLSLSLPSFYHNLHQHLSTLHKQLLLSTNPESATARLCSALNLPDDFSSSSKSAFSNSSKSDLVYDAKSLLLHSTIPNIPLPEASLAEISGSVSWTRVEALSVHSHIINIYTETRHSSTDLEKTGKTRYAWWIIWMRLPTITAGIEILGHHKEAFLIRRASEYPALKQSTITRLAVPDANSGLKESVLSNWAPAKLAEGVGVDARRYVESLLSFAR